MKLSSGPPSLRTMFRSEKMVPKISFASSSALRPGRRPEPWTPLLSSLLASVGGREVRVSLERGRGGQCFL